MAGKGSLNVKLFNNVAEVTLDIEIASLSEFKRNGGKTTSLEVGKEVEELSLEVWIGLVFEMMIEKIKILINNVAAGINLNKLKELLFPKLVLTKD
jgi:hypothetical protein